MIAAGEPLHVWSPNWGGDGFQSDRVRGLLQDLTPLIEQDSFDTSAFIPEVLKIYQSEGKTWALPFLTTGSYIFYNKKIFDEAGVEYPPQDWNDPNWTWEAFVELGKKLTKNVDPTGSQHGRLRYQRGLLAQARLLADDVGLQGLHRRGARRRASPTRPTCSIRR